MSKRLSIVPAILVSLGIAASFVYWRVQVNKENVARFNDAIGSAEPDEPPQPEVPSFKTMNQTLEKAESPVQCAPAGNLRKQGEIGEVDYDLWIDPKDETHFVYLDKSSWSFVVCSGAHRVVAKAPRQEGLELDEQLLDVHQANLRDYDGDGKEEFLVFEAQCVEGPCVGGWMLYRLDGDHLTSVLDIRADRIQHLPDKSPVRLRLEKACFTYDFSPAFTSVGVLEFPVGQPARMLPFLQIDKLKEVNLGNGPIGTDPNSPEEQAYTHLQLLVNQAYSGTPIEQLIASYHEILETYQHAKTSGPKTSTAEATEDEAEGEEEGDSHSLPIYCDPEKLLREITSSQAAAN